MPDRREPSFPRQAVSPVLVLALLLLATPVAGVGAGVADSSLGKNSVRATIDHVIIVVHDLEEAARKAETLGFTTKPGRLHANGLLNLHVEFQDGTELEFMSLAGPPTDDISRRYKAFLDKGEGPVYLALRTSEIESVRETAVRLGLRATVYDYPAWKYLVLADDSGLSSVFFIQYKMQNDNQGAEHSNGAVGTRTVTASLGEAAADHLAVLLSESNPSGQPSDASIEQGVTLRAVGGELTINSMALCTSPDAGDEMKDTNLYGLGIRLSPCESASDLEGGVSQ